MPTSPSPRALVATLGPASWGLADTIVAAGATRLRVNGSHMSPGELDLALKRIRSTLRSTPIVLDLQGAKMRLGLFAERGIKAHQVTRFAFDPASPDAVPLPHHEVFQSVATGDTLSLDDDRVRMRVVRVSGRELEAAALHDATLRPRKGVNVVEHPVDLEDLTADDQRQIEVASAYAPMSLALSFLKDGREVAWVRSRAPSIAVIGKIERREAVDGLDAIASVVDELWICRGDLGAQLGMVDLARFVHDFSPSRIHVPTLVAGQVLEHLTHHANATRSEVCHLFDLLARGYAGLVLSDETAIGVDPVNATRHAASLLRDLVA